MVEQMKTGFGTQQCFNPGIMFDHRGENSILGVVLIQQLTGFLHTIVLQHIAVQQFSIFKQSCLHSGIPKVEAKGSHADLFLQRWGKSA